jgi:hypothetical protein
LKQNHSSTEIAELIKSIKTGTKQNANNQLDPVRDSEVMELHSACLRFLSNSIRSPDDAIHLKS